MSTQHDARLDRTDPDASQVTIYFHPGPDPEQVTRIAEHVLDAMESLGIEDSTMTDARIIAENVADSMLAEQQRTDAQPSQSERDTFCICPLDQTPAYQDSVHTRQCSELWRRLVDRLAVEREKTLADENLNDLAKSSYAEAQDLQRAYERDVWAQEWNSLPTAIDRVLSNHIERAQIRLDALLDQAEQRAAKNALTDAAARIQAMHPGEVKNSVVFLLDLADRVGRTGDRPAHEAYVFIDDEQRNAALQALWTHTDPDGEIGRRYFDVEDAVDIVQALIDSQVGATLPERLGSLHAYLEHAAANTRYDEADHAYTDAARKVAALTAQPTSTQPETAKDPA